MFNLQSTLAATYFAFCVIVIKSLVIIAVDLRRDFPHLKRPLTVTTVLIEPYVMESTYASNTSSLPQYRGYIIDLLDKLASDLGFEYVIKPAIDGQYGFRRRDGTWNGMMGELINRRVDLGAAPLLVTLPRAHAISFVVPYMQVHATALIRRDLDPPVRSYKDLLRRHDISYGTLRRGLIMRTFRKSNNTHFKKMWEHMKQDDSLVFTESNLEGIERARTSKYAFILPDTIGNYVAKRQPCDLKTIDNFLLNSYYAFAVPSQSAILPALNKAIVTLNNTGYLNRLRHKWWTYFGDCNGVESHKLDSGSGRRHSDLFVFSTSWVVYLVASSLFP